MRKSLAVVRLLNLLEAVRELSPINELEAVEEQLLNDLILRWHHQQLFTVGDLMRDEKYPSQSTVYRRLIGLKKKGMVKLQVAADDGRVKYVKPTEVTLRYIAKLEDGVAKLLNQ